MHQNQWIAFLLVVIAALFLGQFAAAQQSCFTAEERARAEQTARVYRAPDPGYDPVLGDNPE